MMTVLGCGSLFDNVLENSFNYVTIFSKGAKYEIEYVAFSRRNAGYITDGPTLKLPVKGNALETLLTEDFISEYPDLISAYNNLCSYDTTTHSSDVFRLFDSTLFSLPTAIEQIKDIPDVFYFLLAISHFRFSLRAKANSTIQQKIFNFIDLINKKYFDHQSVVNKLMQTEDIYRIFDIYQKETKKLGSIQKKIVTFSTIITLIVEFYLTIKYESQEFYKSIVSRKVDFTYSPENLEAELQGNSVIFSVDDERRSLEIGVTCDTAASIKICSLIIKEFEMILHNYERDFSECGFRVYYVLPKLKNNGIFKTDIDSRQFTSYIPKLLPLLAGKNIYSNAEAFAREVIQNSIDAINARKEFDTTFIEEGKIMITISSKENLQFFEISDNGSGMTRYILERYLTTLGLSYYSEVEYNSQNPQYDPISQFGIGFLSCFMLGKHVEVRTCHYETRQGLFLDIPNYDGCFFIEDDNNATIGTTIRIWGNPELKSEKAFNAERIIEYICTHILNVNIDIYINGDLIIKNKQHLRLIDDQTQHFKIQHFVALKKNKNTGIWSATTTKNHSAYSNYGVTIYKNDNDIYIGNRGDTLLNNGVLVPDTKVVDILSIGQDYFSVCANFPPETMELDVSRDKLISFNDKLSFDSISEAFGKIKINSINKKAPFYLLQQQYFPKECSDTNLCFTFDTKTNTIKIAICNNKQEQDYLQGSANNMRFFINYLTNNLLQSNGDYWRIQNENDIKTFGESTIMAYSDLYHLISCIQYDHSKHISISSTQSKYNNAFVSTLFKSEAYNKGQYSIIQLIKDHLIKYINTKNENALRAAMNSVRKQLDKHRANNKTAITNMFKDKRHTAHVVSAENNSRSLIKIAINKNKIPNNLREFLSILIRQAYTGTKNNGKIFLSDVAAITWQSVITLMDYASIICSYEMLEKGVEIAVQRKDFVPDEEWFNYQ